jgi:hypothetical protein
MARLSLCSATIWTDSTSLERIATRFPRHNAPAKKRPDCPAGAAALDLPICPFRVDWVCVALPNPGIVPSGLLANNTTASEDRLVIGHWSLSALILAL